MPEDSRRFARAKHRGNASKISPRLDRAAVAVILSTISVPLRRTRQRIENFIKGLYISRFTFHLIEYDDTVVQLLNLSMPGIFF
jgi:hypothetical protein